MLALIRFALRRPKPVVGFAIVALLLSFYGLTRLQTSASVSSVVGSGSSAYKADREAAKQYGDEAITVLVRENIRQLMLSADLQQLARLEGCVAGKIPTTAEDIPGGKDGPCIEIRRKKLVKVVYGPATMLGASLEYANTSIRQIGLQAVQRAQQDAAAKAKKAGLSAAKQQAASEKAAADGIKQLTELGTQLGIANPTQGPALSDFKFTSTILFGDQGKSEEAVPRLRAVLPASDAALVAVRLRSDLSEAQRRDAVSLVRQATELSDFQLSGGGDYVVSGTPALVDGIAHAVQKALLILLAVGVLVMAVVLAITFPARRRLLPLVLALSTVSIVFGAIGLLGISVNLGTIATLPVLLGLAVDYGVQLHASIQEAEQDGSSGGEAALKAGATGGKRIALAAGATLIGFLSLLASPTPLVQGFALVLLFGVALALVVAATVGVLALQSGAVGGQAAGLAGSSLRSRFGRLSARIPTLRLGGGRLTQTLIAFSFRRPLPVLLIGGALALGGVFIGSRENVETDLQRLVPASLAELKDLQRTESATGYSGEVRVLIKGSGLTELSTFEWIENYRQRVLRQAGYEAGGGCESAKICPLGAPLDLVFNGQMPKDQNTLDQDLSGFNSYLTGAIYNSDRTTALITFGLRLRSLSEQEKVIKQLREELDPPDGVTASVTGVTALVSDASVQISSQLRRLAMLLGALVLVGLFIFAATRSWRRTVASMLPVAMAVGWAGLVGRLIGLPLNPLSVMLGTLVVAIATEFSVLLVSRFLDERSAGHGEAMAIARTAKSTGAAVGASAATAIAGFAVLMVSDIPLLRQFGLLTVVDLMIALLAVVLILPALAALGGRKASAGQN